MRLKVHTSEMPDLSGKNADHDRRYMPRTELNFKSYIQDRDGDTYVRCEQTPDEDILRMAAPNGAILLAGNGNQLELDNAGEQWTQLNFSNNGTQLTFIALDFNNNNFVIGAQGAYAAFDRISFRPDGNNDDMVITRDGRVGIGTTDPLNDVGTAAGDFGGSGLHVKGSANTHVIVEGDDPLLVMCNSAAAANEKLLGFSVSGGDFAYFISYNDNLTTRQGVIQVWELGTGNIGFGTNEPLQNVGTAAGDFTGRGVHIKGSANTRLIIEGDIPTFDMCDTAGAANDKMIHFQVDGGVASFSSLNDDTTTRTANILVMDMGNGRVGIGTATIDALFHVYEGASGAAPTPNDHMVLESDSFAYLDFLTPANRTSGLRFTDPGGLDGLVEYNHTNQSLELRCGNVGGSPIIMLMSVVAGEIAFNTGSFDYNFRVSGDNDTNLLFCEATGAASANNVRIGTNADNPLTGTSKLHVYKAHGSAFTTVFTLSTDLGAGTQSFVDFRVNDVGDLSIYPLQGATPDEAMVGISVAPTAKFHVTGSLDSDDYGAIAYFQQLNVAGGVPVLSLDQDDQDHAFTRYDGYSLNNLNGSLVNDNDVTTRTIIGWIKIIINDNGGTDPISGGNYHVPFYTLT